MNKVKEDKGITLVALVITILLLMILAMVGVSVSFNHVNNMKLSGFYTKLEIAREGTLKIQNTNEYYLDSSGNKVYLKDLGSSPTLEQKQLIESLGYVADNFQYYTAEEIEKDLEIHGVELNLLIDFENNVVINPEGIEIDGTTYYTLESNKNIVKKNNDKLAGKVDFTYQIEKYANSRYRITIYPINVGNITKGIVQYRKVETDYWKTATNNEFIIQRLENYDVQYTDANHNTVTKTLSFSLDENNNVIANEVLAE